MQSITLVRAASKKSVTSKRRSVARMVLALSMTFSASASWAIDLAQSWQLAMNNDPVYAAARANYRAAMEKTPQARAALLPQVNASVSGGYLDSRANTAFGQVYSNSNSAWSLTLSQAPSVRANGIIPPT